MSSGLRTAEEVAARLQVPRSWVYRAAREGDLPSIHCGRYRRFDDDDVNEWIARHRKGPRGWISLASPSSATQ